VQGLFDGWLVKANNDLAVNVNDWHTHLPGFFDHFARLFHVFRHVIIRELYIVFGKKVLCQMAEMAGWRGINNNVHVFTPNCLAIATAVFSLGAAAIAFFHCFFGFFHCFFGFLFQKRSPRRLAAAALKRLFQKGSKKTEFSRGRFKKGVMYCIYDMNSFVFFEFAGGVFL
jgi:hypothetical protein